MALGNHQDYRLGHHAKICAYFVQILLQVHFIIVNFEKTIRKMATDLKDASLLAKLSGADIVAI